MLRRRFWDWRVASFCLIGLMAISGRSTAAQVFSTPGSGSNRFGTATAMDSIGSARMDGNLFLINSQGAGATSQLQAPSGSVSKLDLKAPAKAKHEYEKGYQLLMKKDAQGAVAHLTKSIEIYPNFVAAHNALGTAYLNQGNTGQALEQFNRAIALDDHLPNSYLNLGCTQIAMQKYADAEGSLKKAAAIAPMDLPLLTALTYAEFANKDYSAVVSGVKQIHGRKHEGAAVVHYFAAGAMEAEGNLAGAQSEMETLLAESPKSAAAGEYRQMLEQIKDEEAGRLAVSSSSGSGSGSGSNSNAGANGKLTEKPAAVDVSFHGPTAAETFQRVQQAMLDKKEESQIAEAEAEPDATCVRCGGGRVAAVDVAAVAVGTGSRGGAAEKDLPTAALRVAVDEVAIFFAAVDHGKAVTNLNLSDVEIRDNSRAPDGVVAFRNEAQLPLRLGLVIDSSNSVTDRFRFEQAAAAKFLKTALNREGRPSVCGEREQFGAGSAGLHGGPSADGACDRSNRAGRRDRAVGCGGVCGGEIGGASGEWRGGADARGDQRRRRQFEHEHAEGSDREGAAGRSGGVYDYDARGGGHGQGRSRGSGRGSCAENVVGTDRRDGVRAGIGTRTEQQPR